MVMLKNFTEGRLLEQADAKGRCVSVTVIIRYDITCNKDNQIMAS